MCGVFRASIADNETIVERAPATVAKRAAAGVATVSTSVFHAPHCGHCPCHLGAEPPHSVQL